MSSFVLNAAASAGDIPPCDILPLDLVDEMDAFLGDTVCVCTGGATGVGLKKEGTFSACDEATDGAMMI